jgi:hypothetical protein
MVASLLSNTDHFKLRIVQSQSLSDYTLTVISSLYLVLLNIYFTEGSNVEEDEGDEGTNT